MKKALLFAAALLTSGVMMAQTPTIVSTQVEKRNVIIEEFTGYHCTWCPDGHRVCNEIAEQHAGHAWSINIHQGYFANGSGYTTTYGDNIAGLYNISSWPNGVVNRGSSASSNRSAWVSQANAVREENSPINVAAVGNLDAASRTVTLHIELYYTSNASNATNLLNVAVLQNNVIGPQTGANKNPDYMEPNGMYRHMHMFRTLLTGQWGVEIPATQGTFIDTTITYTIPASIDGLAISDVNDIEFIVFVTAPNHKNILSGTKAMIITEEPTVNTFKVESTGCSLEFQPYVSITNSTANDIASCTFEYDGAPYTVHKTIPSLQSDTIHMPIYTITVSGEPDQNCVTTKTVSLTGFSTTGGDDHTVTTAAKSVTFADFHIYTQAGPFVARIGIDAYGSEASVSLLNQSNCEAVWTEGPWTDIAGFNPQTIQYISQLPNARHFEITFNPTTAGLYVLRLNDGYGDGWYMTNDNVVSGLWLRNNDGEFLAFPQGYTNGEEFTTKDFFLNVTSTGDGSHSRVGIDGVESVSVNTWPNPASHSATISAGSAIRSLEVVNTLGQVVFRTQNVNSDRYELNVSELNSGIYFLNVTTEQGTATQRLSVVK